MSGWRNNPDLPQGLVYEGVSDEPVQLYGETGAQSSILHAFDAALGIRHEEVWLRSYLDTMVQHMPPHHRAFLADLEEPNRQQPAAAATASGGGGGGRPRANVRSFVQSASGAAGGGELRDAYNGAVAELERFRSAHRAFAHAYIAKWARQGREAEASTGTGGSDFMPALGGYRDTTGRHLLA
ncbi:IDO protein [Gonium pectorale]|uniref:IDO protein n=1 Tax=Gonium pectorale TaxID=33097 RepID=A0A150GMH4_GONPE|nr:IDO protein [Gonium pectorale]|eukprot:KXZ50994.1 IDO protein [Gonium pectorale]